MNRGTKRDDTDALMATIKAVEEAGHRFEEASKRYEELNRTLIDAVHEKREAEQALRVVLAELRRIKNHNKSIPIKSKPL